MVSAPASSQSPAAAGPGAPLPTVTAVVPVHDNANSVAELQRRLQRAFRDEHLQIVMVDDASSDGSLDVLRALPVEVVALPRRAGQNAAILAGLAQVRSGVACVLDADLQDPPEAMPALVARLRNGGVQVVFSSRQARFRLSSRAFRWLAHAAFPTLPKTPCLCFALDDATRRAVLEVARPRDYLVAVIGALGVATDAVAVARTAAAPGRSGQRGLRRWAYAARMARSILGYAYRAPRLRRSATGAPSPSHAASATLRERLSTPPHMSQRSTARLTRPAFAPEPSMHVGESGGDKPALDSEPIAADAQKGARPVRTG